LGVGACVLGFGPNPQSPNPQSPIPILSFLSYYIIIFFI
jgi:hypothetical protein